LNPLIVLRQCPFVGGEIEDLVAGPVLGGGRISLTANERGRVVTVFCGRYFRLTLDV
jgi:hypothetical protein